MKAKFSSRMLKNAMILLVLLAAAVFAGSCRNNEVEIPPLTGPSGARLFLQIQANPDHLVIHAPGRPRETSDISIQLKNHLGQGVPGENLKLRIVNQTGFEVNIGRLSDFNVRTDSNGFARVVYTAPDTSELLGATRITIRAVLTNAAYPDEVTDNHQIELQDSSVDPGECAGDGDTLVPVGPFDVDPADPVVNETVCFNGEVAFPTAVEFFWNFGNGDTAEGEVVCTTFDSDGTFQVTLQAISLDRDCGTITQTVVVDRGEPPSCTITFSPTPVLVNQDVVFVASTTDNDGDVRRFNWNFGDGSSTTTNRNTVTHDYDEAGTYTVVLTITDDQGNTATCTVSVTVSEEQEGEPTCSFTVSPVGILPNTPVFVNASTSDDEDGTIVNYIVDFGDGTIVDCDVDGCPAEPVIAKSDGGGPAGYAAPGTYTVTLTVVDDDGNTSSCSQTVTVGLAPECLDGVDNDGDTFIDSPLDPGCTSPADTSELGTTACDNGTDDDGDTFTDFPDDVGCTSPTDTDET